MLNDDQDAGGTISADEQQLLSLYRQCNDEGRRKISEYADFIAARDQYSAGAIITGNGWMRIL